MEKEEYKLLYKKSFGIELDDNAVLRIIADGIRQQMATKKRRFEDEGIGVYLDEDRPKMDTRFLGNVLKQTESSRRFQEKRNRNDGNESSSRNHGSSSRYRDEYRRNEDQSRNRDERDVTTEYRDESKSSKYRDESKSSKYRDDSKSSKKHQKSETDSRSNQHENKAKHKKR